MLIGRVMSSLRALFTTITTHLQLLIIPSVISSTLYSTYWPTACGYCPNQYRKQSSTPPLTHARANHLPPHTKLCWVKSLGYWSSRLNGIRKPYSCSSHYQCKGISPTEVETKFGNSDRTQSIFFSLWFDMRGETKVWLPYLSRVSNPVKMKHTFRLLLLSPTWIPCAKISWWTPGLKRTLNTISKGVSLSLKRRPLKWNTRFVYCYCHPPGFLVRKSPAELQGWNEHWIQ